MGGGTEAFPDLGRHCEQDSCHQLDFLPFKCDGCHKVFCLEHRNYIDHNCKKADHHCRVVVVCKVCSIAIEKEGKEDEDILAKHVKSGYCDATNKYKPKCPVKRCKETLTFSNTSTCKTCNQKVCLKHRFPDEHICTKPDRGEPRFLLALASRTGKDCWETNKKVATPRSVNSR